MSEEIEKEPTEGQKKRFEDIERMGDAEVEEYSGIEEKLSPKEKVRLFVGLKTDEGDKRLLVVTNNRILTFNAPEIKLLGKKERFKDIRVNDIEDMTVEERKGFDILKIRTKEDERKLMVPGETGVQIAGRIRETQSDKEGLDPAEKLEKIGEQKERGHISEEEYNEKKDELMDKI